MRRLFVLPFLMTAALAGPSLAHDDKLAGADWVLAGETGRHAAYLRFDGGRVAGSGGCNRFGGKYEGTGEALRFSPLAVTRMACPPEVMQKEQAFLKMLEEVRGVKTGETEVELLDGEGKVLARLERRVAE